MGWQPKAFSLVDDFTCFATGIFGFQLLSAAGAGVGKACGAELFHDGLVYVLTLALDAFAVRDETHPFQVFPYAVDVGVPGSSPVMIFDS